MGEFSKKYKSLKSKKEIADLFSGGEKVKSGSILLIYKQKKKSTEVAFSVKKKDFKLAVSRNRIKRLLREAFRLNQKEVLDGYNLFFIHLGNKEHDFDYYMDKINTVLVRLKELEQ